MEAFALNLGTKLVVSLLVVRFGVFTHGLALVVVKDQLQHVGLVHRALACESSQCARSIRAVNGRSALTRGGEREGVLARRRAEGAERLPHPPEGRDLVGCNRVGRVVVDAQQALPTVAIALCARGGRGVGTVRVSAGLKPQARGRSAGVGT